MSELSDPAAGGSQFHLYLSPHLDDAVLSCGGYIHRLVCAGHRVAVHTLMAGYPPRALPDSPILQDLHARWGTGGNPVAERRQEDIKALRSLGALARHGTIPDCVYRVTYGPGGEVRALYPSEESLWQVPDPADSAILLLESMPLLYTQTQVLHIPLGAGGHVDHRLVRAWGRQLARVYSDLTVLYYEEYPYNNSPSAVEAALADFVPWSMTSVLRPLDAAALQAKIAAIAHYESQISTFWQDASEMVRGVVEDARQVGGGQPAEREWSIQSEPDEAQENSP